MSNILSCQSLQKRYAGLDVSVLNGVNLSVNAGEQIAIVGASGSGKSTLLHLLGGLDVASGGDIQLMGQDIQKMNETQKSQWRNLHLGFVYQFHHLLPEFTALENVAMPLLIRRTPKAQALEAAEHLLNKVGLAHRLQHMPGELSGGERQRAALARTMVTNPQCILADEPTGNLDRVTAHQVFDLLLSMNRELNTALVVVTHDLTLAAKMQTQYRLQDGVLVSASLTQGGITPIAD